MGGAQGNTFLGSNYLGTAPGWSVAGTADLNTDGHSDLLWQNDSTRDVVVWYMGGAQGNTFLGSNYLGAAPGWSVAGAADLNADGRPDLVWQNDSTRDVVVWYMGGAQGNSFLSSNYLGAASGWKVVVH